MALDPVARLERARRRLEEGRPSRALEALSGGWPPPLLEEKEFLEAEALRAQGFFDKALASYHHVLRRASQDPTLRAEAALGAASALRSVGQADKAERLVRQAMALAQRRALTDIKEQCELELLLIERARERYDYVLPRLAKLAFEAARRKDWSKAAFLLWATGGARRFNGDLAGSQRDFTLSLKLAARAQDAAGKAYALFGLGGVSRIRGRLKDSERFYRQAGSLLARTDDVFGQAYAACGLANALRQQGRWKEAEAGYRRAHVLYSCLGDPLDLAYVDWGLGKVLAQTGRPREALARLKLALKAFERGKETRGIVLARMALASALHSLGKTGAAESLFEAAISLARRARIRAHLETYT